MKKYVFSVVLFISLLATGCSNFLNGSSLKEDIDEKIRYENAPVIDVDISTTEGSISPVGKGSYKKDISYLVTATPSNEFQFSRYQVYKEGILLSDEESDKYIVFDDKKQSQTNFKIINENAGELKIVALCKERPIVISKNPQESQEGSYRDAAIVVRFSLPMAENSIYYDSISEIPEGAVPLNAGNDNENGKIYGYVFEENKYFKNIEIKNLSGQKSLLNCYDEPYFEDENTLVIPTLAKSGPAAGTRISVTISKNMYSTSEEGDKINLYKSESWVYIVNSKTDEKPPVFDKIEIKTRNFYDSEFKPMSPYSSTEYDGNRFPKITFSSHTTQANYICDKKLYIYAECSDLGTGLYKEATLLYRKDYEIDETEIPFKNTNHFYTKTIPVTLDQGAKSGKITSDEETESPYAVDFSDLNIEGYYCFCLCLEDANKNKVYSDWYFFVIDNTTPDIANVVTGVNNNNKTYKISWNSSERGNIAIVKYKDISVDDSEEKTAYIDAVYRNNYNDYSFVKYLDLSEENSDGLFSINIDISDYAGNYGYRKTETVALSIPVPTNLELSTGTLSNPEDGSIPVDYDSSFDKEIDTSHIYKAGVYASRYFSFNPVPSAYGDYFYRVYEDGKLVIDNLTADSNKTSIGFTVPYHNEIFKSYSYTVRAVVEFDGSYYESGDSNAADFWETNADKMYFYRKWDSDNNNFIFCGGLLFKDESNVITLDKVTYDYWTSGGTYCGGSSVGSSKASFPDVRDFEYNGTSYKNVHFSHLLENPSYQTISYDFYHSVNGTNRIIGTFYSPGGTKADGGLYCDPMYYEQYKGKKY